MPEHSFTKAERLLRPADYQTVLRSGKRTHTKSFRVVVIPNGLDANRLGVSVSSKVAGSVQRSRIKRLIKEFFRLNKARIGVLAANGTVQSEGEGAVRAAGTKLDIVISVKRADLVKGLKDVERELAPLLCRRAAN